MSTSSTTLAELCISIAAKAWQKDGEILATGIGLIPRLAVGLSKLHFNKDLLMTDGEAFLIDQPISLGQKIPISSAEGLMTYSRVFDLLWSGHRHAMVSPTQIDKYAQMNISCIGEYQNPKVQLLGVRGFPGNSICHKNSVFIPNHSKKVFVENEVDMVSSLGFNNNTYKPNIGIVVTNLCVFDFNGNKNSLRLLSIHPGVSLDEIEENTGFEFEIFSESISEIPTKTELKLIRNILDPSGIRENIFGAKK